MAKIEEIKTDEIYVGKLAHGQELMAELTEVCDKQKVYIGRIEDIGAVKKAKMG